MLVTASRSALDRLAYVISSATDRARLFENIFKCSKLNIVYMLVHLSICAKGKAFINITFGEKYYLLNTFYIRCSCPMLWDGGAVLTCLNERFTADDASHAHWVMKI